MKRSLSLIILFSLLMSGATKAQSFYAAKKISQISMSCAAFCNVKLDASTKGTYFFDTGTTWGTIEMNKGEGQYYLLIKFGALPVKQLYADNCIDMILETGENIRLFACSDALSENVRNSSVTTVNDGTGGVYNRKIGTINFTSLNNVTYVLYIVSPEQMKKLSETEVNFIHLYVTADKELKKLQTDQDGKTYLEYKTAGKAKYTQKAAQCILAL